MVGRQGKAVRVQDPCSGLSLSSPGLGKLPVRQRRSADMGRLRVSRWSASPASLRRYE